MQRAVAVWCLVTCDVGGVENSVYFTPSLPSRSGLPCCEYSHLIICPVIHAMSQHHRNKVSTPSAADQHDASLLTTQEKLSARQAKRAAKAAERSEKSTALKEEVDLPSFIGGLTQRKI